MTEIKEKELKWVAFHYKKGALDGHKASRAFYYIAMAYIPIFFISISAFGLLGKYLSINGFFKD